MSYNSHIKKYLRALQNEYNSAIIGGQHTAELSFRMPLDQLFRNLALDLNPEEQISVVLEPRNQGKNVGRPDWRIHNEQTLGIYGYIEGKGLSTSRFDISPYQTQIKKYLTLGHKLIITDGIDFVFCFKTNQTPVTVSLIDKDKMSSEDWSSLNIDDRFEILMREFFNNPSPQQCSEEKLVELVAIRTRVLANDIIEYSDILPEEALDESERQIINLLSGIKSIVYNHNDPALRTATVFADFVAQVVMFSLLYAHRVLCVADDTPVQKEEKIKKFIEDDFVEGEALTPFRSLITYIRTHSETDTFINLWVDECIKFLSFVQMTEQQLLNPDYHRLFELFLSKYDPKARFDYGAFYTPKSLASYVVKLTNHVVSKNFPKTTIYDAGNTIIDPCCGTGSFLEEVIAQDQSDGDYDLCGFEILPAPYMLANYRMEVVKRQLGKRKHSTNIILTNTLSDYVFGETPNKETIEGHELMRANAVASRPLKLLIGNPPCSDTIREKQRNDFRIIDGLMEDFRPPINKRKARQNIQKQVNNPFMQFLRWECKKLIDTPNNSVLSVVVPLSFLEAESYKYARKYLAKNFSDAWIVAVDADARTGIRSDSLFNTLQGRAVIVLAREYGKEQTFTTYHFASCTEMNRTEKEEFLLADIEKTQGNFDTYLLSTETYALVPSKPFNETLYQRFWAVSSDSNASAIFLNHCSGIKLAPTAAFTHVKAPMLKRRSKNIAVGGVDAGRPWFSNQDKPPKDEKIQAFYSALNECGNSKSIDNLLKNNIHPYSFRPYLTSNVLLWTSLLQKYSKIGGGGTRLRPEIVQAYSDADTIGFAMAHAPKDLNPTLSQFVSFCWYYPDNDMCTRGNSHIYMNQYPKKKSDSMICNINSSLLDTLSDMTGMKQIDLAKDVVFYTYAILCSQIYLDEFEGALFTVNQSDKRARVPIVAEAEIFLKVAALGKKLAELEKIDYVPENLLKFDYEILENEVPSGFHLSNSAHPFDEENEQLILTDGTKVINVYCPIELQKLNISGYDIIKGVWLKFNSYDFTHCDFTSMDIRKLLDFLNTLATHTQYVAQIDDAVRVILNGEANLITPN